MDNYLSENSSYIQRMNQTAEFKFKVVEPFLRDGVTFLDFGSGISSEFIADVVSTGADYYSYDISPTVQNTLSRMGVNVVTKYELLKREFQFDVIYLSSVFHEILSYLTRQERTETISMIINSLKPGGFLIIRDWASPDDVSELFTLRPVSKQIEIEIHTWIQELQKNSIIDNVETTEDGFIVTTVKDAYEIIFHTVWGLKSLSRESKEQYNVTSALMKWILYPWKACLQLQGIYRYRDQSYLTYLQNYFELDSVPFDTKMVCVFKKS